MFPEKQQLPFYARLALTLIAVVLVLFLLSVGKSIFIPIFFALLVAILLFPIAHWLERKGLPRGLASFIALAVFMLGIAGFIYFFSFQTARLYGDKELLQDKVQLMIGQLQQWISNKYHVDVDDQMQYLRGTASGMVGAVADSAKLALLSVLESVILAIFMLIYTFFILYHRGLLVRFVLALFRQQHRSQTLEVVLETRKVINSYVIGLLTEMAIMAVLNSSVFAIIGVKYALLLGVLAAVLNIVPYLGIYTGMAIAMLITIANGSPGQAVAVAISLIVIHFLDANILLPRIVGGRVKMNPFITIVAVLTGHLIWGIPGMFLFIPLTAIIKIICERVEDLKAWAILIGTEEKGEV